MSSAHQEIRGLGSPHKPVSPSHALAPGLKLVEVTTIERSQDERSAGI
jgi:hypothetical protein